MPSPNITQSQFNRWRPHTHTRAHARTHKHTHTHTRTREITERQTDRQRHTERTYKEGGRKERTLLAAQYKTM